jgi:RNA polymerase sigma factor (sigma-70 family)
VSAGLRREGKGEALGVNWDQEEERGLVEAAQAGDQAAFRQLYDHYLPLVYARVCALVPRSDAEDVTQEVILSVARSIRSFHGRSAFFTWVNSILKRRVADYYRRTSRQVPQVPLAEGGDAPAGNDLECLEEDLVVKQVLHSLPGHQREVILLRLVDELPFKEVATRLGIQVGAAKMRFYRAIAACQERLAETEDRDVAFAARWTTSEVKRDHD